MHKYTVHKRTGQPLQLKKKKNLRKRRRSTNKCYPNEHIMILSSQNNEYFIYLFFWYLIECSVWFKTKCDSKVIDGLFGWTGTRGE